MAMKSLPAFDCSLNRPLTAEELRLTVYIVPGPPQTPPSSNAKISLEDVASKVRHDHLDYDAMDQQDLARLVRVQLTDTFSQVEFCIWTGGIYRGSDLITFVDDRKHRFHKPVIEYFIRRTKRLVEARLKEWALKPQPEPLPIGLAQESEDLPVSRRVERAVEICNIGSSANSYEVLIIASLESGAPGIAGRMLIALSACDSTDRDCQYTRDLSAICRTKTHMLTDGDASFGKVSSFFGTTTNSFVSLIRGCGHGSPSEILASNGAAILSTKMTDSQLRPIVDHRFVHLLSCETSKELGGVLLNYGASAFFGYNSVIVSTTASVTAGAQYDHHLDRALVSGMSAQDAVDYYACLLRNEIDRLSRIPPPRDGADHSDLCDLYRAFEWDALDPNATLTPA